MEQYIDQFGNLQFTQGNQSNGILDLYNQSQIDINDQINMDPRNIAPPMTMDQMMYGSVLPNNIASPRTVLNQQTEFMKQPLDMNRFQGVSDMSIIDETTNDEQDQNYIDQVNNNKQNGLMSFLRSLPTPTNLLLNMLPKQDPRATNMRNFYGNQYGLTSTGSLSSGIMQGYNPVSGGLLNMITGGKFGKPTQYGLANAARRRIENIANRKIAQTAASQARIKELQNFARADTTSRARQANPNVYASADKKGFTGPGGGFDTSAADRAGTSAGSGQGFSNKSGRGRTGY